MRKNTVFLISFLVIFHIEGFKATEYCSGVLLAGKTINPNCFRTDSYFKGCQEPISSGSIARLFCQLGYKKPNGTLVDTLYCNSGEWDHTPFQCVPECGIWNSSKGKTPWHVLFYFKSDQKRSLKCGGTVINVKLVVSAAHCFWDNSQERPVNKSDILAHVNQNDIDYNAFYSSQIFDITEIYIPEGFKSGTETLYDDIAILVLDGFIQFFSDLIPICIEFSDENEKFSINEMKGFIPGSRKEQIDVIHIIGSQKETRKQDISVLSFSNCENSNNFNDDKVFELTCKHPLDLKRVCSDGDSGGGFIIRRIVNGVEKYFLKGIVNNVSVGKTSCPYNYSVTITNIQKHSAKILEYLTKYSEAEVDRAWRKRITSQATCEIPFIPKLIATLEEYEDGGMKRNLSAGSSVEQLNKIVYSCEENYRLLGTTTNYCYFNKWAENHPVCVQMGVEPNIELPKLACRKPNIQNLMIFLKHWNPNLENEITENYVEHFNQITYKCKRNYHLVGRPENNCEYGKWDWDHPVCINIRENPLPEENCEIPFLPNIAIVLEDVTKRNILVGDYLESDNTISYSCSNGQLLHGRPTNYCHEGKWLAEHPSCVKLTIATPDPNDCELSDIPNVITVLESVVKENESSPIYVKHRESIAYRCKKNHLLEGSLTNLCYEGKWRDEHPHCTKITSDDCEIPGIPNLITTLEGQTKKNVSLGSYAQNLNMISYTCRVNHILEGKKTNICIKGKWIDEHPSCIKYCPSDALKGVSFSAVCESGNIRISCDQYLRTGTIAKIFCQFGYKKPDSLVQEILLCDDSGNWDYSPFRCEPICGTEQSETVPFIRGGEKANITAVPWHAAIYSSVRGKYSQICGGTIISSKLVLTAAHCFWQGPDLIVDHSFISVAVGKYKRDFYAEEALTPQYFNVSEIYIPEGFRGPLRAYQDDIAILVLTGYIEYKSYIKPICIEWLHHEQKAIHSGLTGRVAGWGRTKVGLPSEELLMLEISTLSYTDCVNTADARFRDQIAADKFCISSSEEESVCPGDSGGGFVIPKVINGLKTYFLWGIVSNGLTDKNDCNTITISSLTNIQHYADTILYYQKKFGVK